MNDQGKPDILHLHQLTSTPLLTYRMKGESHWRPRFSRACSRVLGVLRTGIMNDQGRLDILKLHQLTTLPLLIRHIRAEFPLRLRYSRASSRVFGVLGTSRMNDQGRPDILRPRQLTTVFILIRNIGLESPLWPRFSRACSRGSGVLGTSNEWSRQTRSTPTSSTDYNPSPQTPYYGRISLTASFQKSLLEGILSLHSWFTPAQEESERNSVPKCHSHDLIHRAL